MEDEVDSNAKKSKRGRREGEREGGRERGLTSNAFSVPKVMRK